MTNFINTFNTFQGNYVSYTKIFRSPSAKKSQISSPSSSPASPTVLPQAAEKISSRLASRCGLKIIPPKLRKLAEEGHNQLCPANMSRVNVGMTTCGQAAGADIRFDLLVRRPDFMDKVLVRGVGCLGACFQEPIITIRTPDGWHHLYTQAGGHNHWSVIHTAQKSSLQSGVSLILREREPGTLTGFNDLIDDKSNDNSLSLFFRPQKRWVMENCGLIDPFSLPEYAATGGYFALAKVLGQMRPEEVSELISASGLRGRGGAGFKTGLKWADAAVNKDKERILIANADEGDPSAYMDRTLMESDPHRILEGLILAAYAIEAHQAYIFIRREYSLSAKTLRRAIQDAEAAGFLGENIMGSRFSLRVEIIQSAGAFVCGEETAALEVLQGCRGEPRLRPPYPTQKGYENHPTVINNVETLANVPWIITHGAAAFQEVGSYESPGTKMFCLTGDIPRGGCLEVPLGTASRTVVETIGGATRDKVKAIQIGGPSGGIVPYQDFAIDYSTVAAIGAMIGSGGLVVLNKTRCLVDLSRHLIGFMADESCGRCLYCRDGLAQMSGILQKLTAGDGTQEMITDMEALGRMIADLSACGLGRSAVNPLLTSLRYFRQEFVSHLKGICPAASCQSMIRLEINTAECRTCDGCVARYCPVGALKENVTPNRPGRYFIDENLCLRCRSCAQACPYSIITSVSDGQFNRKSGKEEKS